ncbi:MAG: hypothetical protein J3R72DRAFT_471123 [Linnemannia gamsii]|nr:MAG: hypothetical protein J3R72DRAFT_471123 [Linnemannia gamsii]
MNNNYDPLEDTTYDDLEEDPYSHSSQEGEFSEDFPSKLRRSATGAQNADDEMTDGPVDENSKEGEVESFLSSSAEACFWGQPGEMSTDVRADPPAVLEPPLLLRTASMPESTGNPVASPFRSRVSYHPYRSQTSSALSDTTDSASISGSFRRESTDGSETRDAPRGFPRTQTSHSRATSIAIIEDMRTGTPLYDMTPTQVREEQRRQLRAQYTCSERWLQVVERCHPYELPSPEDCSEHAPEEMKALIHVPNRARARGNATLSHFFRSVKVFDEGEEKSKYLCAIMTDDSCKIKLSGGAGMIGRESHMNSIHKAVYEAFRLFQGLQNCLGRLPVDPHASQEQQEYQAPSTPKRTPRKTKFQGALPGIPIPTLEDKATVEACWLNLLSEGAVNYSLFDNPNFRKIKALTDGDNPPRHGPN